MLPRERLYLHNYHNWRGPQSRISPYDLPTSAFISYCLPAFHFLIFPCDVRDATHTMTLS